MLIDYTNLDSNKRYKIMSNTVIPRPIAWIVTEDEGIINAAPFSYFTPLSSDPAIVVVSIGQKEHGIPKDTLHNIIKQKKATICFVNEKNVEEVKLCANMLDKNQSEITTYDIKTQTILEDFPPIIASTQTALFCTFYDKIDLPSQTTPVLLEIKFQYAQEGVFNERLDGLPDNIGRTGIVFKKMEDL
ncbi:MAG: flavin reductase [Arcobacteraceae bacterium]|jgi:flavin reductase (DIM6/NTAB) family NADH-FMN oxidoreductase RutF|nr:flavin reductase [Arcobacteraceae bacterium]